MSEHGAGLGPLERRLLDAFADATTSSPGDRVKPVTVRDGDCYALRSALDELGRLRVAARQPRWRRVLAALSEDCAPGSEND